MRADEEAADQASGMRRETSRVSFLTCPFCVRASSSSEATVSAEPSESSGRRLIVAFGYLTTLATADALGSVLMLGRTVIEPVSAR
jgi:hypothetical protein